MLDKGLAHDNGQAVGIETLDGRQRLHCVANGQQSVGGQMLRRNMLLKSRCGHAAVLARIPVRRQCVIGTRRVVTAAEMCMSCVSVCAFEWA